MFDLLINDKLPANEQKARKLAEQASVIENILYILLSLNRTGVPCLSIYASPMAWTLLR